MKRLKIFFGWLYVLNHPDTKEYPLTVFERFYKMRTGFGTAWRITKTIMNIPKQQTIAI